MNVAAKVDHGIEADLSGMRLNNTRAWNSIQLCPLLSAYCSY